MARTVVVFEDSEHRLRRFLEILRQAVDLGALEAKKDKYILFGTTQDARYHYSISSEPCYQEVKTFRELSEHLLGIRGEAIIAMDVDLPGVQNFASFEEEDVAGLYKTILSEGPRKSLLLYSSSVLASRCYQRLIDHGVKPELLGYIHEYPKDNERARKILHEALDLFFGHPLRTFSVCCFLREYYDGNVNRDTLDALWRKGQGEQLFWKGAYSWVRSEWVRRYLNGTDFAEGERVDDRTCAVS